MAAAPHSASAPGDIVGVIGGSGISRLFDGRPEEVVLDTPWGPPSDSLALGTVAGRRVAFLPRHGRGHTIPPHRVNSRANLWALRHLGVERVVSACAVGSLRREHAPGSVVVCDGLVNWTSGRADTYFEGPEVAHLSAPGPYCDELRPLAAAAVAAAGLPVQSGGTCAVVNGPRFSTRAESRFLAAQGWDVVNMTQYPEAVLARELGMCVVALALVTDWDSGLVGAPGTPAVTQQEVFAVMAASTERVRAALLRLAAAIPTSRTCNCGDAPVPIDPHG